MDFSKLALIIAIIVAIIADDYRKRGKYDRKQNQDSKFKLNKE
ncbi:hypothetical protein AB3329_04635 [Streptococcus sp. H31]